MEDTRKKELGQEIYSAIIKRCGGYGAFAFHTLDVPSSRKYIEFRVEKYFNSIFDTNYECDLMNEDELTALLEFVRDEKTHAQIIRKLLTY